MSVPVADVLSPDGSSRAGLPPFAIRRALLPETLLILGAPSRAKSDLRTNLGRWMQLEFFDSLTACGERLCRTGNVAVLLSVPVHPSDPMLDAYERLRASFHQTPFVPFFVGGHSGLSALTRMSTRDGGPAVVSTRLHDDAHWYGAISSCARWPTARRLWDQCRIGADDTVTTLMLAALRIAHEPISLPQMALAARMHERTLRKYCTLHGLPSPQWLIGWARCLLAAYYLDEAGRPIQTIAEMLRFTSAVQLANHLRRYTKCSATELRRRGALRTTAHCFELFLRPNHAAQIESEYVKTTDRLSGAHAQPTGY
jgi:AraC-like DNA-binding protein